MILNLKCHQENKIENYVRHLGLSMGNLLQPVLHHTRHLNSETLNTIHTISVTNTHSKDNKAMRRWQTLARFDVITHVFIITYV